MALMEIYGLRNSIQTVRHEKVVGRLSVSLINLNLVRLSPQGGRHNGILTLQHGISTKRGDPPHRVLERRYDGRNHTV